MDAIVEIVKLLVKVTVKLFLYILASSRVKRIFFINLDVSLCTAAR